MPTKKQLFQSMESQFEFPETRRTDDPMYRHPVESGIEMWNNAAPDKQERMFTLEEVIPNDEELAAEIIARYNGNSRGNPIAKKAFIDAVNWIKKRSQSLTLK